MARDSGTWRRATAWTTPCTEAGLPAPGDVIGGYLLRRLLGAGTMGLVFEAAPQRGGAAVAIKVLSPALWHDGEHVRRLLDEAQLARQVRHPGLVEILGCDVLPGGPAYLVMELLGGESLGSRLRLLGGWPLPGGLAVLHQTACAMAAVHGRSIVHRDLKPENIMLTPDPERPGLERVKVLDFGLAMSLGPEEAAAHDVLGTPDYMAPEQCVAGSRVDRPADVYALGVMAYELLSGQLPFDGGPPAQVLRRRLLAAAPPLGPAVPQEVAALVARMLCREPRERPEMAEVAAALERLAGRGVISLSPPGPLLRLDAGGAAPRVLLVDDDAELSAALREALEAEGHRCHVEGDGARAVDAARRFRPDLVLLDVGLPGRSGLTLCWEIKAALGPRPVPVVLLSGHTGSTHHGLGRALGADAYVDKPFAWEHLLHVVRLFLRHGEAPTRPLAPAASPLA